MAMEIIATGGKMKSEPLNRNFSELDSRTETLETLNKGITIADIQEPAIIAHRGARNIFPEASIEAYRGCMNLGLTILEMDVQVSADGTLICHHDDTMDRTTNKTGDVIRYSTMGFKSAKIDCLEGWSGETVLFEDLLREFGNKAIYVPEVKDFSDTTSEKLTDVIIKHNLKDNVIIQSFVAGNLTYPLSQGLEVCYLKSQEDVTPSQIVAWGFQSVGISSALSDTYVTDCINAGLKVYIYTINRRHEYDYYINLGVNGVFSDDPLWVSGNSPILEWDSFRDQVFTHGMFSPPLIADYTGGDRGGFVSPNKFGWQIQSADSDFTMQGWAGELASAFTLSGAINVEDAVSGVRWAAIAFCTQKDYWDDYTNDSLGYHLLVRESGDIDLYMRDTSGATLIGSMTTTALSEGQSADVEIDVTGTSIIVTRTDTSNSFTVNDTTYRNGYLHFGRRYTGVTFENVNVVRNS